jgi:D-cysteine desulfhydrase
MRAPFPLTDRFPALAALPRRPLGRFPTPVDDARAIAPDLWIKRDDLNGDPVGGNKLRALEFLLGDVHAGDRIVTTGSVGSTHALATAVHARAAGARVSLGLWKQEMNASAERVTARLRDLGERRRVFGTPVGALAWATVERMRGARWVPPGGTSSVGMLGHVNAALELAEQIAAHQAPAPARVVVPLGTGGTAAGLALGFRIVQIPAVVVGVRVVPRLVGRRGRVVRLANAAGALIRRLTGHAIPTVRSDDIEVVHDRYGGAYARELDAGREAALRMAAHGIRLDGTYTAKACASALAEERPGPTLLWLTFDGRLLTP